MFDELAGEQESLREKFYRFFTRPSNPKNLKVFGFTFLIFMMIIGGAVLAQGALFHSYQTIPQTPRDPYTILWKELVQNGFQGWSFNNTGTTAGPDVKIKLTPSATFPAIAVTKSATDFSTVAGKNFGISFAFLNTTKTQVWNVKLFLTTNKTISTSPSYDPYNDNQVALMIQAVCNPCTVSGSFAWKLFMQTELNTAVSATDQGTCSTSNTNSCFASGTEPIGGAAFYGSSINFALNFTGNNGGSSGGSYFLASGVGGGSTLITSNFLPQFKFESVPYYVGVWEAPNNPEVDLPTAVKTNYCVTALSEQIPCLTFYLLIPFQPTVISVQPSLDTGGFFGPIIRALIQIGVFVVQNIINFLSFLAGILWPTLTGVFTILANATKLVLNSLGGFFGLGNLGDELISFFSGIVNWLTNIVGSAFGQILNMVNLLSQLLSWLGSVFGGPIWTGIIGIATLLASGWATIITAYGFLTQLSTTGLLGVNYYFLVDWIFGMFMLSTKGMEGFKSWVDLNGIVFHKLAMAMFFFIKESFVIALHIKQMIVNWV
jgi:hypothetical protein